MYTDPDEKHFVRFLGSLMITIVIVLCSIWLWVVKEPLAYSSPDYPIWLAKKKLVGDNPVINLAFLGDSGPMADLIPARIGRGVVNLALVGGTTIEVYYLARNLVSVPSPPMAVTISLTPYHFTQTEFFWADAVGFNILNYRDLEEVRQRSRFLRDDSLFGNPSPGDLEARLKLALYSINFPSYYFPSLVNSGFYGRYDDNMRSLNLVLANRGQGYFGLADGSTLPDHDVSLSSFVPLKILDDYFDRTLGLFDAQDIPVYFIAMPHNEASNRLYAPGLREAFTSYLDEYARRYPNFHVLGDPWPVYPSRYFGDPFHLNKEGAILWSDSVAKLLNDAHVEGGPFGAVENEPAR